MKSIYLYITSALFVLFAGLVISGCSENKDEVADLGLSIKVYSPIIVVEGQEVVITGTGFNDVTAVVFPGNISITSFNRVSNNMIRVITPAGVSAAGGDLVVQAGNESVAAHIPMTVGTPQIRTMVPNDEAGIGREILISGTDMNFYSKIIFPGKDGDIVIDAIDFDRKSTILIRINVPSGIADGPARIKLITMFGREDLLPEINLIAETYVDPNWARFCGDGEKSWVWDDTQENEIVWGSGGHIGSTKPEWWSLSIGDVVSQFANEGRGAEMIFAYEGASLTKVRTNDETFKGTFSFDFEKLTGSWAIGELYVKDVEILGGQNVNEDRRAFTEFFILQLDENKMVLSAPSTGSEAWGEGWFWMFKAK